MLIGVGLHAGQNAIKSGDAKMLLDFGRCASFRDEVYWSAVETSAGVFAVPYASAAADRLFREVPTGLMILDYGNSLYGGGFPKTADAIAGFVNYAKWAAQRYGDRVWGFEVWNEQNIGLGNGGTDVTPAEYVALVEAVVPVLRQHAPDAKIVCGSVTGLSAVNDWIEDAFELGVLDLCDAFSLHPYVWAYGSGAHGAYAFAWVDEVRDLMEAHKPTNTPGLAITEIGWPNHTGTHATTEAKTATYLAQTLLLAKMRPWIDAVYWYEMQDQGTDAGETEDNYGIVRTDLSSKPAMLAMRKLAPLLGPATLVDSGILATNRYWATLLLENGDEITAVWMAGIDASASFTIASSDSFASASVVYGTDPTLTGASITPTIGEDPLVIRHAAGTIEVS